MKTNSGINLDGPIYETLYCAVNSNGTIIARFTDRDEATRYAKEKGLRMVKTIIEVTTLGVEE